MLRVGMTPVTLCVTADAERPGLHSHAERGNDPPYTANSRSRSLAISSRICAAASNSRSRAS
ncbi:hypothetical protein PkoCFBP13504_13725 [Pseudomonas koreensis]|nr:hypothetical protein PkoCFBP13504_13725 [Pseudomonas koreensis]